jgi:hypothetical protein
LTTAGSAAGALADVLVVLGDDAAALDVDEPLLLLPQPTTTAMQAAAKGTARQLLHVLM